MIDLHLTKITETASIIKFRWTPPPDCRGYLFFVNDKQVARTWNSTQKEIRFSKVTDAVYKVVALGSIGVGIYPPSPLPNDENYSADPYGNAVYSH